MFVEKVKIKMHDTDAAGLIFFGHQFKMAHDVYEEFMMSIGFSFAKLLREKDFFVPIVHAEADYKTPLFVGDELIVTLKIENIGKTSYAVSYEFNDAKGICVGAVRTVHVCISKKTKRKISLPKELKLALAKHR